MNIAQHLCVAILALTFLFPATGNSQDFTNNHSHEQKIGIALSGGGAKGFAHIGVLKVLEEEQIPIHVVTGSSMGAVVGGLYAVGYTPDQIREIALTSDWQTLFNDNLKPSPRDLSTFISNRDTYLLSFPVIKSRPHLPTGLVDGQNLSMLLYRLTLPYHDVRDFSELPVAFGAIATDLSTGEARRFESGYLPDAIRASSAIPSIFKPVKIDDKLYIDGGVARSIPVEDARAMGADIVMISDVSEPVKPVDSLDTFVEILFQAIGFHQVESDSAQVKLADFYIRPDIEAYDSFSYEKTEELIQKGEEAARAMIPELKARLDSLNLHRSPVKPKITGSYGDTLDITGIRYQNIDDRLARQTEIALDINTPEKLTFREIERKIHRLYETELFSQISYRIQEDSTFSGGQTLSLDFSYSEPDRIGFSMRYDSPYKASLLFGAELRDKFIWGDRISVTLRLGEVLGVSTHYNLPIALKPVSNFHIDMDIYRSPIDLYTAGNRLSSVEVEQLEFSPSASIRMFDHWELRTGIHAEFYNLNEAVGNILLFEESQFLLNGFATMEYNSLNRTHFPTRGQRWSILAEGSSKQLLSERTFRQLFAEWETSIPVLKGVEILTRVSAGYSSTSDLPLQYRFYLGGLTSNPIFPFRQAPFWGYSVQQLSGATLAAARSALQFHLGKDIYLQTGWNTAHVSESISWDPNDFDLRHGYGISLGALTIIGPVKLSLSSPDFRKHYAFKVDIGYSF